MDRYVPGRILIIEDDADSCASLLRILELDNHQAQTASTDAKSLERVDWSTISLVILDRQFPVDTADEFLPCLKRMAPDAAVVVITGHGDLQGAIAALREGAADYILKPVDPDELRARLKRIRDHQRAQAALRASEERFRRLFEAGLVGIGVGDRSGRWLEANDELLRILGQSREDLATGALRWSDMTPEEFLPLDASAIAEADRCGSCLPYEKEYIRKDGTRVPVLIGFATLGTTADRYINVVRDLTASKRSEELLRGERDFARGLIEMAPAIVVVLDTEGRVTRYNRYAEELSGFPASEVLGRDFFTRFLPERSRSEIGMVFRKALADLDTNGTVNPLLTSDGREREVRWSNRLLRDSQGKTIGILAIGQDITDLRDAQERALRAGRLAAIGQMITGLTHESRNALQRSQACLEMLALQVRDRPEAQGLITRLQKAQDDLHRLYDDVSDYAAPIRLERRACDLAGIWREAWDLLDTRRGDRSASLEERLDVDEIPCFVDPFRLGQVFRNIFENSLVACPDAVAIQVSCTLDEVDGKRTARVVVRDNGPGLSLDARRHIFEPFYTTKTRGTGLGMAISRRIVEAHGGQIAVGDGATPGAEIIITLPRGEP